MNNIKLTLGIPCRDDGQDLEMLADGLLLALDELPSHVDFEGIIAVNGSSDAFYHRTKKFFSAHAISAYDWQVIKCETGKLNAQKAVADTRNLDGYIGFVDSDVVLEPPVLRLILEELENNPLCIIAYGQPVPVFPTEPNKLHQLMRVHYALRERCYRRKFFHGRTFVMREWLWEDPHEKPRSDCRVARRLALDAGPLVDDILLSRIAVARWGTESIQEIQAANVHFDPTDTLRGLYASALRNAFEIARLDRLYPGHAAIQKKMFRQCWEPGALMRFSWRIRLAHRFSRILEGTITIIARGHVYLVEKGLLKTPSRWIPVPGTKSIDRKPLRCRVTNEANQ